MVKKKVCGGLKMPVSNIFFPDLSDWKSDQ